MNKYTRNGTIAEMLFVAEALKKGYEVSLPVSHDSKYDVLLDNGKYIFRCQVKKIFEQHCKWYSSKDIKKEDPKPFTLLAVETRRRTPKNKTIGHRYSKNDFDYLVAYKIDTNEVWIVPIEIMLKSKSSMHFTGRSEPAKYKNAWP